MVLLFAAVSASIRGLYSRATLEGGGPSYEGGLGLSPNGIDPNNANAHFNPANVFASQHQIEQAAEYFRIAARLDSRYAQLLVD